MNVTLNHISGVQDALASLYISKRNLTPEKQDIIRRWYVEHFNWCGFAIKNQREEFKAIMDKMFRYAEKHITLGKFIDFSFTVTGLHRGAQDDLDSHAERMHSRIIRSSTRLSEYGEEKSDWYKDKIISTDEALSLMSMKLPDSLEVNGNEYTRTVNGYVRSDLKNDKDALRGLYMLSIPSTFTFRCDSSSFAHIVKMRDMNSNAHPELKLCVEEMLKQIQQHLPQYTREHCYKTEI